MNVVNMPNNPCPFCKKNEATQLCDFIVDYYWTTAKDEKGRMMGAVNMTCDNQMCASCANNVASHEICPVCMKLYEHVKKNHKRVGRPFIYSEND